MILPTLLGVLLNGKAKNIHPLRFARPTSLWRTVGWRGGILL